MKTVDMDCYPHLRITSYGVWIRDCQCGGRCCVFYDEDRQYRVECEYCGTVDKFEAPSFDEAIRIWNRQANQYLLSQIKLLETRSKWFDTPHYGSVKAYRLGVRALKKEVSREPTRQSSWWACPSCNQGFGVTDKTPNPAAVDYCFHCGQKLDWDRILQERKLG